LRQIANLPISIQDREGDIETGKMITDGKAGLPPPMTTTLMRSACWLGMLTRL
jgi:hypothetical protein